MNIAQHVYNISLEKPLHPAIIFEGRTTTYQELEQAIVKSMCELKAAGVKKGDRVALVLPNVPGFIIFYCATVRLGAIAVCLNSSLTQRELIYFIED